jgi:hypothetical protein
MAEADGEAFEDLLVFPAAGMILVATQCLESLLGLLGVFIARKILFKLSVAGFGAGDLLGFFGLRFLGEC